MGVRRQAREVALKILYGLDILPREVDKTLTEFWFLTRYSPEIQAFASRLVRGVMEHKEEIDKLIIQNVTNWTLDRMATVDRNILRFAIYELLYEDEIPPKVTINEALDIAKKYSTDKSSAFINGILDKIHHTMVKKKSENIPSPPGPGVRDLSKTSKNPD
ncbi:MAG TPA: transcription antitermination factor NusB [Candidatus Limnocylindrales bacterium]|nr:transcription antitermination factor NusB [Candidatus Limnocylindrales bacterium]